MTLKIAIILAGLAGLIGIAVGYFLRLIISLGKKGSMELEIRQMMLEAEEKAKKVIIEAETKSVDILKEAKQDAKEKEEKFKQTEDRLIKKESLLDNRQADIDKEVENLKQKVVEIKEIRERAEKMEAQKIVDLQSIAKMSEEDAKNSLLSSVEKKNEEDILGRMKKLEEMGAERLEHRAKEILTTSIQRLSTSVSPDIMSTMLSIPSDEMKGKIIGKEGKNIKAFERVTGVEVIVDDTPGVITISSFDPIRRQVARVALENLLLDGRIQPAKIEKIVEKAQQDINKIIKDKGDQAVYECGIINLDPRVVQILGRLHFRTSYGQNVLQHSIEMSHMAGMIAEEVGANVQVAKAGALLHDIGKALDHEVAGTHVEIGRRILQKFGVSEDIIKAMQSHHEEYPVENLEAVIVQVADTISGGRPGARSDSIENYLKRLGELEALANSFDGVEKSYALQAGREIRIFVTPEKISDIEAKKLARDVADKIEGELKYPGEIKVTIIRESRVIEYAR
ncbi:MAG: ribonuclease Y [Candidatus Paceibacterota bacterium]|jgi:ribonuclease Y